MTPTRRDFLAASAATALCTVPGLAAPAAPRRSLRAAPTTVQLAPPDYPKTEVWAYNGQIPGETVRVRQGGEVHVRLENGLPQPTTIHWHGLRLPNAMDGAAGMTQDAVPPGGHFDYRFVAKDAGTFWYHPHHGSLEQISRGLSGALIVDEPDAPDVDRDQTVVLDDWRMTPEASLHDSFDNRHDRSHAGRIGNYVTANGRHDLTLVAAQGERMRLRLINTATARIFRLRLQGLAGWIMALDGMPLDTPAELDELVLAPAQRADLFVDVTADPGQDAFLVSVERDGSFATMGLVVEGAAGSRRPAPAPLPPNPLPVLDPGAARQVPLRMDGGAMRGLPPEVTWNGARTDARDAIANGQFWSFNQVAGMAEEPFLHAALGETISIPVTNATAFPHAMHLHGTHFRERRADGSLGPWRDTVLVAPEETRDLIFLADNPGDWMFHCHMLAHQASGMMTWIRVG